MQVKLAVVPVNPEHCTPSNVTVTSVSAKVNDPGLESEMAKVRPLLDVEVTTGVTARLYA